MQHRISLLEGQLATANAQYQGVVEQLSRLQKDCREAYAREEEMQNELAEKADEIARLSHALEQIQAKLDAERSQSQKLLEDEQARADQLETEITAAEETINGLETTIKHLHEQLDRKSKNELTAKVAHEADVQDTLEELDALQQENDDLRHQMNDLRNSHAKQNTVRLEKIQELENQLHAAQLDAEAARSLSADLAALRQRHEAQLADSEQNHELWIVSKPLLITCKPNFQKKSKDSNTSFVTTAKNI
eukprot:GABV01001007.1.p1 GENE.GABV01001007.1~~GABV01001007.1.p1  ORF type:complete len:249 (-),score=67.83 GABV01001007.1:68-814(-)